MKDAKNAILIKFHLIQINSVINVIIIIIQKTQKLEMPMDIIAI